ncbi:RHO1 GDP-GTP exchange protein 2, partial [Dipsacomyces acuminosporus]
GPGTVADGYANGGTESPDLKNAYSGSRSTPDLNMNMHTMKDAINEVANSLDQNPVPKIPAAHTSHQPAGGPDAHSSAIYSQQLHQHHLHQQQYNLHRPGHSPMPHTPYSASNLSIKTDVTQEDPVAAAAAAAAHPSTYSSPMPTAPAERDTPGTRRSSKASDNMATADAFGERTAPRTPAIPEQPGSAASTLRSPRQPVNTDLAALLENASPVYPAMLSAVAKTFYSTMSQVLQTHLRNGLEYPQCFTGRDAVDTICAIIQTNDRNLAIVVGRALAQQKLFHDVEYERRLRDDPNELFAFEDDVVNARAHMSDSPDDDDAEDDEDVGGRTLVSAQPKHRQVPETRVNGVFVMLTDCYSPTCSTSQPCYSVTCPRQRLQQDHLRKTAKSNVAAEMKQEKLWSMSVPKEVVKSVSRKELDRQERLYEVFYGEKDYVRDLCILRDLYMRPLHNEDIVDESRRKNFITKVFKNALAILAENARLQRELEMRQKESFICYQVGDVFLEFVEHLESYLEYCANQPYSMHFLEAERKSNPRLNEFLEKTDRRPEGRKLGVQHFLTRPPTRLARYPLVLNAVLKYTPEGHPDRKNIPHVVSRIEAMLNRINAETGKAQNRLRLYKIDEKLVCSASDRNDLRLTDDQRKLIRDSQLRKRGGNDGSVIQVLLLDHMLLMCKIKVDPRTGEEKYTIYKHPIPLQLLTICYPDDPNSMRPRMAARRESNGSASVAGPSYTVSPNGGASAIGRAQSHSSVATPISARPGSGSGSGSFVAPAAAAAAATQGPTIISIDNSDSQKDKYSYPLQITHLGRRGFTVTLYSNKLADRQQWYQCIEQQQLEMMERHRKFELEPVACQFPPGIRINTADVFDHGRCVVIGTDRGLYMGVSGKPRSFQQLTHLRHDRVYQIEVHEKLNVMAMVADKDRNLYVYPLDLLMTATSNSRSGHRIKPLHTHVSFFRFGHYLDYDILCSVKSTTLSNQTIIHVYKPVVSNQKNRSLGRFLSLGGESAADNWKCIKECYIAAESTSLHFLRSRLCVGCNRGFEIVDLATMNTQSLLDPADTSLAFINKRDTSHPIALFRVHDGEFLLCYDEFAFYVNRNGQRARSNWMIHWVGTPSSFKLDYPYILAFDSLFIEVYHVETAAIVQVIITGNCTSLSPNKKDVSLCVTSPSPTQPQEVLRIQHKAGKEEEMLPRTKAIYDNSRVLDCSGQLLFRAGKKRLKWYLDRGLAERVDDETIQLTFKNKGDGRRNEPFYLQDMENKCVVCGQLKELTMHHIVPYQYRRFMAESTKSHSSYDLLPLCMQCHDRYERHAVRFKKHLEACFAAPLEGLGWVEQADIGRAGRAAAAVMAPNAAKIPGARREELKATVRSAVYERVDLFGRESQLLINQSTVDGSDIIEQRGVLRELCSMKPRTRGPGFQEHGEIVVTQLEHKATSAAMCATCREMAANGVQELVFEWRRHFVEHAQPRFLPNHWVVDYPA